MTIAATKDEIWEAADGAPQGPEFELRIPSRTEPGREYHLARDEHGAIWHPGCRAFLHRRRCWHLTYALALVELPEHGFREQFTREWERIGGALASGDDLREFWNAQERVFAHARQLRFQQLGLGLWEAKRLAMSPEEVTAHMEEVTGIAEDRRRDEHDARRRGGAQ